MLLICFLLVSFISLAESRVTFSSAEVLDTADLKGVNELDLRCFSGCRVFSPTKNSEIVIVNSSGTILKSLQEISDLIAPNYYELPPGDFYKLVNKGTANPTFVLYAVERGSANYMTPVIYLDATTNVQIVPETYFLSTALSSSGAIQVYDFEGDFSDGLPSVHATGFDSVLDDKCRPVYQASSTVTVRKASVPIFGPIATINFKTFKGGKSARVRGGIILSNKIADSSAVFVSPGFVGCDIVGDSLYSQNLAIAGMSSSFTLADTNGFSIAVNGEYSIAKEDNALNLTVNADVERLFGKNTIQRAYPVAAVLEIDVAWDNNQNSDRFALQIDVESGATAVTKSGGADLSVSTTTKGVNGLTSFFLFAVTLMCLMWRCSCCVIK